MNAEALRSAVMERLSRVIHPETGSDVVRLRLIEDLTVDEMGRVSYTFHPTAASCPIAAPMAIEIRRAIREVPGVTAQTTRVEGCLRSDELTDLLQAIEGEHDRAGESTAAVGSGGLVRQVWHS